MRKLIALVVAFSAVLVIGVVPASAVQYGQPDGNGHPNVGLVVFFEDGIPLWRCSGTLLDSNTFLTAGHCAGADPSGAEPDAAEIWFGSGFPSPIPLGAGFPAAGPNPCAGITGYPCTGDASGTPIPHPDFTFFADFPNTHDVGVVELDAPRAGPYASLAPAGYLDDLATRRGQQDRSFTVVGYGLQSVKPVLSQLRTRMVGTVQLTNLRSSLTDGFNVQTTDSPGNGHGSGGTCFGDSGGPLFVGSTNMIAGVTSFGLNQNCKGTSFFFRMDISDARSFLDDYVVLP